MKKIFNLLIITTITFVAIPNLIANNSYDIQNQTVLPANAELETIEYQERLELENRSIDDLEMTQRTQICLKESGIYTIHDFLSKTEDEIKNIKNLTRKSLAEIRQKMNELDWHFKVTNKKQEN